MYVLLIYCLLAALVLRQSKNNRADRNTETVIFAVAAVFFLVRFNIGPDTGTYHWMFDNIDDIMKMVVSLQIRRNQLFLALTWAVKKLFSSFAAYAFVLNLLSMGLLCFTIFRYSRWKLFSMLIFIGGGMLEVYYSSGVRQSLASMLFLYALFHDLREKRYVRYGILCILAGLIHETAFFALPLIPLHMKQDWIIANWKKVCLGTFAACLLVFLTVGTFLPRIQESSLPASLSHFSIYFQQQSFSLAGTGMQVVFLILTLGLLFLGDRGKRDPFDEFLALVIVMSVFFYGALCMYPQVSRITDFWQIAFIILLPDLVMAVSEQRKRLAGCAAVILLHGFLLFADLEFKISRINRFYQEEITVMNYPYFTVFSEEKIASFLETED